MGEAVESGVCRRCGYYGMPIPRAFLKLFEILPVLTRSASEALIQWVMDAGGRI